MGRLNQLLAGAQQQHVDGERDDPAGLGRRREEQQRAEDEPRRRQAGEHAIGRHGEGVDLKQPELRGSRDQDQRERRAAAVVDSQSVKTTDKGGVHGYDAGKKVNGRKRHIVVDPMGMIIAIVVHAANIQDRPFDCAQGGAKLVMAKLLGVFPRLKLIWADGGYAGPLVGWAATLGNWVLEIVKRTDDVKGFKLLAHRWVVERTFGGDRAVPSAQQGLRVPDREQRGDDQNLDGKPYAPPTYPG